MDKRAAFSRACSYLNFQPAARWLALAVGIASCLVLPVAIFMVGLVTEAALQHGEPPLRLLPSRILAQPATALGARAGLEVVAGLTLAGFMVALVFLLLRFAMHELAIRAAAEAGLRLRRAIYHQSLRLGALALRPAEAGSLAHRQVESVRDALLAWQLGGWPALLLLLVLLLQALVINVWLTLLGVLGAGLLGLLAARLASGRRRQAAHLAHEDAVQLALFLESLTFLRLVKTHGGELFQQGRTEAALTAQAAAAQQGDEAASRFRFAAWFALLLAGSGLLLAACLLLRYDRLSVPELVMFGAVLASAGWPVRAWLDQRRRVRLGATAAVAVFQFLDRPGDVTQTVGAEVLPRLARRIEFDNVSLRGPSEHMLLENVSLALPAGQRLAIVGADDAEKHALVYLLARLLDPTSGEIRIDEHNLRWVTFDSLRKQLGVVLWLNLVSSDTVAANIAGGDPGIPMPRILEAAKLAHAHQFISRLPQGYDTVIGELGHALKPGERFRVALARAILREPALFIIEEPPAVLLDDATRGLLEDTYARVLPGRTAIFLPHRAETIALCGSVLVLQRGRVAALGAHRDLMKQCALYRQLFAEEFNEFARVAAPPSGEERKHAAEL